MHVESRVDIVVSAKSCYRRCHAGNEASTPSFVHQFLCRALHIIRALATTATPATYHTRCLPPQGAVNAQDDTAGDPGSTAAATGPPNSATCAALTGQPQSEGPLHGSLTDTANEGMAVDAEAATDLAPGEASTLTAGEHDAPAPGLEQGTDHIQCQCHCQPSMIQRAGR